MIRLAFFALAFVLAQTSSVYAQTPAQPTQTPARQLPPKRTKAEPVPAESTSSAAKTPEKTAEKTPAKRVPIDPSGAIRVEFENKAWNSSVSKIDSASIIMRDNTTGRSVQLQLSETAPDSGVFTGIFSINWGNVEKLQVEFFIPPQDLLSTTGGQKKVNQMIANKELRRSPFVMRKNPRGTQTVEIYETREQAVAQMQNYRSQITALLQAQQQQAVDAQGQKVVTDQQIDAAKLAALEREKAAAAIALAERARLEQVESQRIRELQEKERALSAAQKKEREQEAAQLASEAMALFKQEKFKEAAEKFDKAVQLDPDNQAYYFQYGVTLYKLENFNKSLVYLRLAKGAEVNELERDYFIALNYYRQKEFDAASEAFDKIIATKNPDMAPSAAFYKGVVRYEQEKWEDAKASFQVVLDSSKDPNLDRRAEAYIEQILRIQQFEEERKRKWQLTLTLGEMYDSNVLLVSDSSRGQGTATNTEGFRTLVMGSARYRPVYDQKREFAAQLDLLTMYTLDKSLKYDQSLRNTDPLMATLTLPYTYKGVFLGKGYKLDVTPGYETIYMSVEGNTNKEIISSLILNTANMLVMTENVFSNFNLELRKDNSKLDSSVGDNDSTAIKTKLLNSNLIFVNKDKTKIVMTDTSYTLNNAQGKNVTYNRIDLGLGYMQPFYWETTGNVKLSYFKLTYPQNSNGRADDSYTLMAAASKKLTDIWSAGLMANYNINNSNVEANKYNKWTAMLTFTAVKAF